MKIVLQRVKSASVEINSKIYSKINKGILLLFGVEKGDRAEFVDYLANKILNLRIFNDELGKMNLSVLDIQGEIMIVSQFTLAASTKKGTRPSFDNAMEPNIAKEFYEKFIYEMKKSNLKVENGIFGADMKVQLTNDGPVTFILEKRDNL